MSRIAAWLPLRMSVSQLKRFNDPITPRLSVTLVCSGPGFFGQYSIASGAFLYYSRRNSSASEIRLKPRSGMLHEREGEQVAPASLQTIFGPNAGPEQRIFRFSEDFSELRPQIPENISEAQNRRR